MSQTILTPGDAAAGTILSSGNDGTLVLQSGAAGSKVNALSFAADGTPTLLKVPAVTAVQSMVSVNSYASMGSTNTAIVHFGNTTNGVNGCIIQGTDITLAASATLGDTFTVNTPGVYAITFVGQPLNANGLIGISVNATGSLSSSIYSLAPPAKLANFQAFAATANGSCGWTGYLAAGSVIRAHTDGSGCGSVGQAYANMFTITRVS